VKIESAERDALIEELAKDFYKVQGYYAPPTCRMQSAKSRERRRCVAMAIIAVNKIEVILENCTEKEEEKEEIKNVC
jgi:hypothetical protein